MKLSKKTFQQQLWLAIVASIITVVIDWFLDNYLNKEQPKIISRETTINRNVDGSIMERKLELYK